jgi:hypothetical protein
MKTAYIVAACSFPKPTAPLSFRNDGRGIGLGKVRPPRTSLVEWCDRRYLNDLPHGCKMLWVRSSLKAGQLAPQGV